MSAIDTAGSAEVADTVSRASSSVAPSRLSQRSEELVPGAPVGCHLAQTAANCADADSAGRLTEASMRFSRSAEKHSEYCSTGCPNSRGGAAPRSV